MLVGFLAVDQRLEIYKRVSPRLKKSRNLLEIVQRNKPMPVSVVKRNGRFRLVDADGKVAKGVGGKPVDGNGHGTEEDAQSQAAAINEKVARRSAAGGKYAKYRKDSRARKAGN